MLSEFFSIDIETLGLNVKAPIIEFGAVHADWMTGRIINRFHTYVTHKAYDNCEPYAMAMHPEILMRIATKEKGYTYTPIENLGLAFYQWLPGKHKVKASTDGLIISGKNAGSFDVPMLKEQSQSWRDSIKTHRRVLDPAMLFWNPAEDEIPPGTGDCQKRSGQDPEVKHTALEDAEAVANMIFVAVGRKVKTPAAFMRHYTGGDFKPNG